MPESLAAWWGSRFISKAAWMIWEVMGPLARAGPEGGLGAHRPVAGDGRGELMHRSSGNYRLGNKDLRFAGTP
jgi:hypothetical protein